jgi:MoaA/NifB/PqqE/SkfB family radical SAM enzyme
MNRLKPSDNLMVNFHIDGLAKTHDAITGLEGAYDKVIEAIKAAKKKGYFVCTNTTIYKQTDINELRQLFKTLDSLKVDGFLISPAYGYVHVGDAFFMTRKELAGFFDKLEPDFKKYNFSARRCISNSVQGKRDIDCAPWTTRRRNPFGWRSPCYQLADKH